MDRKVTKATEMLKAARLKKGYSQQQVAVITGVHVRQYQRLEYGERAMKSINMRLGLAVCAILEIDPFEIVDWLPDGWETVTREKKSPQNPHNTTGQTLLSPRKVWLYTYTPPEPGTGLHGNPFRRE